MKRRIYILCFIASLIFSGCLDLDQEITTQRTYDNVTRSFENTKYRCSAIYTIVKNGFQYLNNEAMMASATDEAEHTGERATVQKFNNSSFNAYDNPDNVWNTYYQGIRWANQFLVSSDSVDLDLYKYDPSPGQQAVYKARLAEIKNWKYEARFLRAYFYFELVKRYGGVPILTTVAAIGDDYSNIKRNTLAECIKFIVDESDSAATQLPVRYITSTLDLGRATKGAALALKGRILLYAASDLYNSPSWASGYAFPELISLTGDRAAKWQAAADAAKAVIDLAGTGYTLSTNYGTLFGATTFSNAEVIFRRGNANSNSFEKASIPIGYDLGQSGTTPSENLVSAYEVKVNATTAVPFDWSNPAHAANPYATTGANARDPRLAFTILTNNTTLKGRPLESFIGGRDGLPKELATKTGYYLKKYVDTSLDLLQNISSNHAWVIFRYAEMYLNYAEALNEVSPENANIAIYVNKVRQRASVNMPALPSGLNQVQMRNAIRHERQVEFAFEDHRYWDLKRWMLAPEILGAPLKGVRITKNADMTFNYQTINVEDRVFTPKMYFYPIPQNELFILTNLKQNPLW